MASDWNLRYCATDGSLYAAWDFVPVSFFLARARGISRYITTTSFSVMTDLTNPFSGGWGIIAVFACALLLAGQVSRVCHRLPWACLVGLANVVGVLALFVEPLGLFGISPEAASILSNTGGVVLGGASTLLLISWADTIMPLGAKASSLSLACAFLGVVVFDVILTALVEPAVLVVLLLLCVASLVLVIWADAQVSIRSDVAGKDVVDARNLPTLSSAVYHGTIPVWAALLSIVFFGTAAGIVQSGSLPQVSAADYMVDTGRGAASLVVDLGVLLTSAALFTNLWLLRGENMAFYRWTVLALLSRFVSRRHTSCASGRSRDCFHDYGAYAHICLRVGSLLHASPEYIARAAVFGWLASLPDSQHAEHAYRRVLCRRALGTVREHIPCRDDSGALCS